MPQRSHFVWVESEDDEQDCFYWEVIKAQEDNRTEHLSAFLASELGAFMGEVDPDIIQMAYNHVFHVEGSRFITPTGLQLLLLDPDLCGRMIIYLLENHLISVEELGK